MKVTMCPHALRMPMTINKRDGAPRMANNVSAGWVKRTTAQAK